MKQEAYRHPKMRKLARLLKVPVPHAIGIVSLMLDFTADFAERGDIGRYDDGEIAGACQWDEQDSDTLVDALKQSGWLDEDKNHRLIVHDYHEHAPEYLRKRLERKGLQFVQTTADKVCRTADKVCRTDAIGSDPTEPNPIPNPTQPNPTEPNQQPQSDSDSDLEISDVSDSDSDGEDIERTKARQVVLAHVCDLFAPRASKQGNGDRTTAERMFDRHVWPAGLPPGEGKRRTKRAATMVGEAKKAATKPMAYWVSRVKKEWPE